MSIQRRAPVARRTPLDRSSNPLKRSRPRARRHGSLSAMKREAERLLSLICRRDGWCVVAGCCVPASDACHILPKSIWPSIRYELLNLFPMCRAHHQEYGSATVKADLTKMRELFLSIRGEEAWEKLVELSRRYCPFNSDLYMQICLMAREYGLK